MQFPEVGQNSTFHFCPLYLSLEKVSYAFSGTSPFFQPPCYSRQVKEATRAKQAKKGEKKVPDDIGKSFT